jgi:alpha,alpha-trehalose phosphorylase
VKPEIFISHSCKDKETARPVGLSPQQIKARAERLSFARELREDLQLCCDAYSAEQKARNFDYYERITVRDSSLSACTQAVLAAEVGHLQLALMDLQDLEHNVRDGLHIASLAGTWIALVNGFGGMRDHAGVLSFAPRLPDSLTSLSFSIVRRKLCLRVEVTARAATYRLTQGTGTLQLIHHGELLTLKDSDPIERPIPELPPLEPTAQPPGREPQRRSPRGVSR